MSLAIKRPKGVTVFVILGIIDAILMTILIPIFYVTPEFYSNYFDTDAGTVPEFAILKFNDYFLEFSLLVIAVDIIVIMGLLSAKKLGRKIVIGGAIALILSYLVVFGFPGLILNSILVWYMFRTRTKEYFEQPRIKKMDPQKK